MRGTMIWKDKRIPVVDVEVDPRLDENGVRGGWVATTDDAISSRMFYPADMFTFEEQR
jgi:hypothetical protein